MLAQDRLTEEFDIEELRREKEREKSGTLRGMEFVVTGKLLKYSRNEIKAAIHNHGGIAADTVTINTDFVIVGDVKNGIAGNGKRSRKLINAERYGVQIITEGIFEQMLAGWTFNT